MTFLSMYLSSAAGLLHICSRTFQKRRSDGKLTEVVKGLKAGASYAAAGSFVVKSELGKASAEHSH